MAISGIFAGQLFNLLLGFGGSLVTASLKYGTLEFDIFNGLMINNLNVMILIFALFSFILQIFFMICARFKFNKRYAVVLLVYYLVFFISATVISLYTVFNR